MTFRRILTFIILIIVILFASYSLKHPAKVERLWATLSGNEAPITFADGERLQRIPVRVPRGDPRGLVILISDKGGPQSREIDITNALLAHNLIVANVDFDRWKAALDNEDGECVYLVSDLEALSKDILRRLDFDAYFHPVVMGLGEGGAIAYAAASDSPKDTLAGAVAIEPSVSSHTRLPSCTENANAIKTADGGYSYEIDAKLPVPATIINATGETNDIKDAAANHIAALIKEDQPILRIKIAADTALAYAIKDESTSDLPIVDLPSKNPAKALIIFFSGDGGWRDIDMEIGNWLKNKDVHVIGIDSLRYFWNERTPEEMAEDIQEIIKKEDPTAKLPVALFGYSLGADTLPFAWPLMDKTYQDQTAMIALMGVSKSAEFKVSIDGWLGDGGDRPVLPALQAMPRDKTICVYGDEEDDTSCPGPSLEPMRRIKISGGHHFDEDYQGLAKTLYTILLEKAQLAQ